MSQLLIDDMGCCYTASEYNYLVHSSLLWQPLTHQRKWSCQCFFEVHFEAGAVYFQLFISGDCAGQERDFILFLSLYSAVDSALWADALLSWKMQSSHGKCLAATGHKCFSNISWYPWALRFFLQMPKCPLHCMKYIARILLWTFF